MRKMSILVMLGLLVAACGGASDVDEPVAAAAATAPVVEPAVEPTVPPQPTPEPEPTATVEPTVAPAPTPEPEPELALLGDGSYEVGAATLTIDADTDRPLTVEIWFPITDATGLDPVRYSFITGDYYESPRAVVADDTQLVAGESFPLVVYSHGSGGLRWIHSDYTEVLASHGYVVAAPDHTGNTAIEVALNGQDEIGLIAVNRPNDVSAVIDAMTDANNPVTGAYVNAINVEQVAVTGHSFGGFSSYAVVSGYETEFGEAAADDRVDAIITLAPAVGPRQEPTLLSDVQLSRVDVPALAIVGTDDKTTPVEPNVERAWELTSSPQQYRLELVAAEHQSFTDVCDYLAAFDAGQAVTDIVRDIIESFAEAGCAEGDMATDRVQELTNTFALRFLDSVFNDAAMITPAEVTDLSDIIYQSQPVDAP